jgi:hypothetical protein
VGEWNMQKRYGLMPSLEVAVHDFALGGMYKEKK